MSDLDDILIGGEIGGRRRPRAPNLGHRKEFCKRGHEFTPENTRWVKAKRGLRARKCRACERIRKSSYTSQEVRK